MADNNLTANSSLADEMQAVLFDVFKMPFPARKGFDFEALNNAPLTNDTVKMSFQSLSVIRSGLKLEEADFSPETVRETISALEQRSALTPNPNDLIASLVHVPEGANAPIDPSIIDRALRYLPASVAILERAVAASAQPQVQPNTAAVTPTSGAASGSASTSASFAAVPQADNTQSVKAVETMLSSFGIDVGKVDGTKDPQFDAAVSNLKDIIKAVVPSVSVSAGAGLTQSDIAALKTGIETFAASQQFKDLQTVRTGKLPVAADASMMDKSKIAGAEYYLSDKSESVRIAFALEQKAKEDPALAAALQKVPTSIIDKMPTILDTLGKPENRNALIAGLQAVYAPPASASSVANPATTTQAAPAQPAATTQATTTQPAVVSADPAGAQGTTPTQSSTPAQSADDKVAKASVFVETVLYEKITPVLDDFAGKFSMLNIKPSDILPVLTQADVGGDFDVKSQRMAATTIMGLKSLAGIEPADGTYNEAIGNQLKLAILTDDKMQMVRDAFEVPKMGVAEAKALLSDEKESIMQAQSLHVFFDSLNTLEKAKKLDRDKVAQSTTTRNMMLDGLALGLDKWAPGLKDTLKDFFMNSEIGQMAGAVLAAFGINVGRLWGDKDDAAAMENAKPTISRVFNDYITEAQNQLGPNAPFNEVMAKTRENVMDKLENSVTFNLGMKAIFGNADKDTIKNAIDKALAAAESAPNAQAATEQYANTIVELGKQYSKGEKIDFDKAAALLAEAQQTITSSASDFDLRNQSTSSAPAKADPAAVTAAAATGTTPAPSSSSTTTTVPATSASSTAPAAVTAAAKTAAVTSTNASATPAQNSAAPVVKANMAQATTTVATVTQVPADMANNKINAGDTELYFNYIKDPKDYVQKLMPSEGRVKAMLEVVNENAEVLSMSLPMSMTKDEKGQIRDSATKEVCGVLEELYIRAQIAQHIRNGDEIDVSKLDRKMDESADIRIVASYMLESVVESENVDKLRADVDKFRKAAESLRADATLEKGFINTSQLSLVQMDALVKEMKAAAPVVDPNAVKVDPNDAALYQRYRDLNALKGKGPDDHCVPLVFMAREENGKLVTIEEDREAGKTIDMDENNNPEGYNVYVGIVVNNRDKDPTNDQFKVMEVKDFIKNELHVGLEDPVYDALRKDYSWSDTVGKTADQIADLRYQKPTLIDTTIKNALCLNDPAPELAAKPKAAEPVADAKAAVAAVEQEAKKANVEQPRPFPRRYSDLLPEPFRISQNEAENLDGGKLNLNEMYEKVQGGFVHMGTAASGYPAFKEGPYMVTPLENKADREKLGGDVVISRMMNGEMYHSVIDTKKDMIIHPDDYSKVKNGKIDFFSKDESPKEVAGREFGDKVKIGLNEFLDRNIAGQNTHNDRNGTPFTEMAIVRKTDAGYGYGRASDHIFGLDKYADFSKGDKLFDGAFDGTTTPEQIKEYAAENAKNAEIYRKLTNDYINEHVERTQARVMAEHKIGTEAKEKIEKMEISSTYIPVFGKASNETTFSEDGKEDSSKVAMQNIKDMGIAANEEDMSADVGGFNYQQRRSLAYGGAVA